MDDSTIMCDEVVGSYDEETKTIPTNLDEKKATCKTQNFYILLAFLLITTVLFITVSIYCCLIKYQAKQKHLLPFHNTNNELREVYINKCIIKMESSYKLKEIDINLDDIVKIEDFDLDIILIDQKS